MTEENVADSRRYMVTWPYVAGFLDCDGWICRYKPEGRTRITCGFTQSVERRDGMEALHAFLESQGISAPFTVRNKSWKSDIKMINIMVSARTSVILLLENIVPYLVFKRDIGQEALAVLQWIERDRLRRRPRESEIEIKVTRSKHPWTAEEIELLKSYTAAGYNVAATAARLGRSCHAVAGQRYRLGLKQVRNPL